MGASKGSPRLAGAVGAGMAATGQPQTGKASMFPGEPPRGQSPLPPGLEEGAYRRQEITRERDRSGRREEMYRDFQQAAQQGGSTVVPGGAVERGASAFGAAFGGAGRGPAGPGPSPRSGVVFGPGRANRMPEVGTPEYAQLVQRARQVGAR